MFWYFPVVPSGTTFSYTTRKRKSNKKERHGNSVYTSAISDLHTYLLHRSAVKFTILLKSDQQAAANICVIFRCRGRYRSIRCRSRLPQIDGSLWRRYPLFYQAFSPPQICNPRYYPPPSSSSPTAMATATTLAQRAALFSR